jgi:sporulation protein YlmC with PRC-barrel domain
MKELAINVISNTRWWIAKASNFRYLLNREGRFEVRLSDENLRGRTVIAADGQAIGEVAALFLDSDAWRVESLQIKLRKDIADQLGASRGMFHAGTLELPVGMVQSVGDAVVLSVLAMELRQVLPGGADSALSH